MKGLVLVLLSLVKVVLGFNAIGYYTLLMQNTKKQLVEPKKSLRNLDFSVEKEADFNHFPFQKRWIFTHSHENFKQKIRHTHSPWTGTKTININPYT